MTDLQMLIVGARGAADGRTGLRRPAHAPRHGHARHRAKPAGRGLMGIDINVVISAAFVIGVRAGAPWPG